METNELRKILQGLGKDVLPVLLLLDIVERLEKRIETLENKVRKLEGGGSSYTECIDLNAIAHETTTW
jgi:uncharacterized protein involved in exopolysaccharide biosynthesis